MLRVLQHEGKLKGRVKENEKMENTERRKRQYGLG